MDQPPADNAASPAGSRLLVVDLNATARTWALPPEGAARIVAAAPPDWRVHVVSARTFSDGDGGRPPSDEALAAVGEAEAYFGFGLHPALLGAAPRLAWVQSAAAGVRSLLTPELRARELALTNAAGVMAVPMAEWVVAGVLHFLRGFDVAEAQRRGRTWDRGPWATPAVAPDGAAFAGPREVGECRACIVGVRGVGAAVAERLSALGATCVGVRRRAGLDAPPGFAATVGPEGLDDELARADVVVLAAPSTAETEGLLDARRLGLLRPSAIVVNVGRGALVDEEALVAALAGGRLRGAALDVAAVEPLPAVSALWTLPNVLLTPHVSATSARFWPRMLDLFLDNWARWREGRPLRNRVDVEAGY